MHIPPCLLSPQSTMYVVTLLYSLFFFCSLFFLQSLRVLQNQWEKIDVQVEQFIVQSLIPGWIGNAQRRKIFLPIEIAEHPWILRLLLHLVCNVFSSSLFFFISCVLWHDVLLFAQDHHPNWLEDQVISHKPFTEYLLDCSRSSFGAEAKKQAENMMKNDWDFRFRIVQSCYLSFNKASTGINRSMIWQ